MSKVELYQGIENGKDKIGVKISDPSATLDDLLVAWQPLCDDEKLHKMFASDYHCACRGCQVNCCHTAYVVPDLIAFRHMCAHLNLKESEFALNCLDQQKRSLGFLRLSPNPCLFLKDSLCTVYPGRALLCRFYICSDIMGDTEQLIYSITWTGIAAAQAYAREKNLIPSHPGGGFTSLDLMLVKTIEEFSRHPGVEYFRHAREYAGIPLKPFLPERL